MKKHITHSKAEFLDWFPELDKCPVCHNGRSLFDNLDVASITLKVKSEFEGDAMFIFQSSKDDEENILLTPVKSR